MATDKAEIMKNMTKKQGTLFLLKRASIYKKIERINKYDENSNYKVLDTLYNVSPLLYEDPIFNEEGSKPVIINEDLLKIKK